MSKKNQKKDKKSKLPTFATVWISSITCAVTILLVIFQGFDTNLFTTYYGSKSDEIVFTDTPLEVHFLDVGQADSTLITLGSHAMLIDGGNNSDGSAIAEYLKNQNITKLDMIIATHPHADHIGGLDYVIDSMDVENVYMPKIPDEIMPTTKTFKDFLLAVKNKDLKIKSPKPGLIITFGNAKIEFLAPTEDYDDLNNMSIIFKLKYNGKSFLFTGDAEAKSEKNVIAGELSHCDVLKVGHHGSSSSTTEDFLNTVSPSYAIIQCGIDNTYGHPHQETLDKLSQHNVTVYRTDTHGTIVFKTDGGDFLITYSKQEV